LVTSAPGVEPVTSVSGLDFTKLLVATDADGDSVELTGAGRFVVTVVDDIPTILATSNLVYVNAANSTTGGTGIFEYRIGADSRASYSISNSDFSSILLAGTVGVGSISNSSVTWAAESDSQAVFNVFFKYDADPISDTNALSNASGTLTFDKVAGTYTLKLSAPLEGYSFLKTSETQSKQSFNIVGSADSQPEIVVSKLADNFYVRFTASEEVGGNDKVDLSTTNGDGMLTENETFTASQTWVSISGDQNGVAGDTLQAGEVLNMDFYTTSPGGDPSPGAGDAKASVMYLKLGQLGSTEDMVVLLKLINPLTNATTTRVVVVGADDIYRSGEINPYGITFTDGSDGVVIIEANDYKAAGENYLIYGAQLLVSTEGVNGSGINLNRATGVLGGSSLVNLIAFAADSGNTTTQTADSDVIKVVDIGLLSPQTSTLDANLEFGFSLIDADGDATGSQQLVVDIVSSGSLIGDASDQVLQATAGNDLIDGNGGVDTASYLHAAGGVTVSLALAAAQVTGGSGSDTLSDIENLMGSNYADSLTGNSQDNILWGGAGDDILIGGLGNDRLIGGLDNDTYLWKDGTTGTDTIQGFVHNFNGNVNGDRLDLSDLLSGENQVGGIGNLLNFIDITTADLGGGWALDTVIKVSTTAAADPATSTEQTIVLQDVNLYTSYSTGSESSVILGMLGDGTLKVDVA
ncbi:calcium-binding protein, partial [Pseudomonas sp.]|uniref:calcium-binding protein n=1 Tax=Pseudomonas sp. TaxID=306 RepID=UPI003BB5A332